MNLKSFFTFEYLFQINPIVAKDKLYFAAGAIIVLLAIVLKIAAILAPAPADRKYRNKFYVWALTLGLGEILWYFFRYENVRFFGSYFAAWLLNLAGFVWLAWLIVTLARKYGPEKAVWQKERQKQKYLPK